MIVLFSKIARRGFFVSREKKGVQLYTLLRHLMLYCFHDFVKIFFFVFFCFSLIFIKNWSYYETKNDITLLLQFLTNFKIQKKNAFWVFFSDAHHFFREFSNFFKKCKKSDFPRKRSNFHKKVFQFVTIKKIFFFAKLFLGFRFWTFLLEKKCPFSTFAKTFPKKWFFVFCILWVILVICWLID